MKCIGCKKIIEEYPCWNCYCDKPLRRCRVCRYVTLVYPPDYYPNRFKTKNIRPDKFKNKLRCSGCFNYYELV